MSKYKNKKTYRMIGQERYEFDSLKEARRFDELIYLLRANKISKLEVQPEYILSETIKHNGITVRGCKYISDFRYIQDGKIIVEDVKSEATRKKDAYIVKKKWFLSLYGDSLVFKET